MIKSSKSSSDSRSSKKERKRKKKRIKNKLTKSKLKRKKTSNRLKTISKTTTEVPIMSYSHFPVIFRKRARRPYRRKLNQNQERKITNAATKKKTDTPSCMINSNCPFLKTRTYRRSLYKHGCKYCTISKIVKKNIRKYPTFDEIFSTVRIKFPKNGDMFFNVKKPCRKIKPVLFKDFPLDFQEKIAISISKRKRNTRNTILTQNKRSRKTRKKFTKVSRKTSSFQSISIKTRRLRGKRKNILTKRGITRNRCNGVTRRRRTRGSRRISRDKTSFIYDNTCFYPPM